MQTTLRELFFPKTLDRFNYLVRFLPIKILDIYYGSSIEALNWHLILYVLIIAYFLAFIVVPRLRSYHAPWWACFAVLIPFIGGIIGLGLFVIRPNPMKIPHTAKPPKADPTAEIKQPETP